MTRGLLIPGTLALFGAMLVGPIVSHPGYS
jgi:hypothetical protein